MESISPDWEFDRFDDGSQSKNVPVTEKLLVSVVTTNFMLK